MRRSDIINIVVALLLLLPPITAMGQHPDKSEPCGTVAIEKLNQVKYPQRSTLDELEERVEEKMRLLRAQQLNGRIQATVLRIPIIVHIVHNGEAIGNGTNLSQQQVAAQLEVLNEDFRKKAGTPGDNDNPAGADIEIEFCLSPVDQNGNPMSEPGIHRHNGNRSDWTTDEIENILKPSTIWNPNLFYNIWTVKFDPADANLIGYAQFPDDSGLAGLQEVGGPASTDGVVIRYQSFGSVTKGTFPVMQAPYNRGRTLTHETGHWLGLRHIWGDGNCANDFVADTPPASGPSSGCPIGKISCGGVNMVQNYMDYSDDACMNIFTEGQKLRIRAVMEISPRRKSLVQGDLCGGVVAAAPVPNFVKDKEECILLGSEVTFTDLSSNFPNAWQWTFEGGDPNTSTERNPKVTYNSAGTFNVTLVVSNNIGEAQKIIQDYVVVSEEGICTSVTNFLPSYTPSVLPLSDFVEGSGYVTGHNSDNATAYSEQFLNECGYNWISGASVKFGLLEGNFPEDASIYITAWNARGPQTSPGSAIERKQVLLKTIQQDIANGVATDITFDRETPLFSRAFHVGVEIEYGKGYTLAIESSAKNESTNATSWVKRGSGKWELLTIAFGANIAMNITPHIGVNPSLQVSASKQLIYPGEQVTLNGRGASIFSWNADDGSVVNKLGPQLIVHPTQTTTYITSGSGLALCDDEVQTTIYVREGGVVGTEVDPEFYGIDLFPNPGLTSLAIRYSSSSRGIVSIQLFTIVGHRAVPTVEAVKSKDEFETILDTSALPSGLYIIKIKSGEKAMSLKWIKK